MKAAETQLLPFLDGKKQFIIPIYQRTYSYPFLPEVYDDYVHQKLSKSDFIWQQQSNRYP